MDSQREVIRIVVWLMVQVAADTIKASLDKLPGFPRTQIGFLTFDSTLHFYNLKVCTEINFCRCDGLGVILCLFRGLGDGHHY